MIDLLSYLLLFLNKEVQINPEFYLMHKRIEYRLGGNGPIYYDCGGIVTEAYRKIGYKGPKISSHTTSCKKPLSQAKKYDILVNPGIHTALISKGYSNGSVEILDYVNTYHYPSYRIHGNINGSYSLDRNCLLKN